MVTLPSGETELTTPRRNRAWRKRAILVGVVAVILAVVLLWLAAYEIVAIGFPGIPAADDATTRMEIVRQVEAGSLRPDSDGAILLPFPHANLASGGRVIVNRGPYGLTVSFPARIGMVDKWEGYIYQPNHPPAAGDEDPAFGSIVGRVSNLGGGWYYVWFG